MQKNACWVFETVQIILIIISLICFTEKVYGSSPYSPIIYYYNILLLIITYNNKKITYNNKNRLDFRLEYRFLIKISNNNRIELKILNKKKLECYFKFLFFSSLYTLVLYRKLISIKWKSEVKWNRKSLICIV